MKTMTRREDGFTLLEVMVAMVVLSVGLLGLLSMMTRSMHANAYSGDYITANNLLIEKAEALRKQGYAANNGGPPTAAFLDSYTSPKANVTFNRQWTVAADAFVPELLKAVTITVTWQRTSDSIQHSVNTTFSIGRAI